VNRSLERILVWVKAHQTRIAAVGCAGIAVFCIVYITTHTPPWQLERLIERHKAEKPAKLEDYMAYGFWLGAAAGVAISLFLAATAFLWAQPTSGHTAELRTQKLDSGRRFWIFVGIIVLVAAGIRSPRMDKSFWGDESWAYSDLIGGRYSQNDDGSLDYQPHDWKTTFFWDKGLNNQYLFTIVARFSNETWQKINDEPTHAFSETALRMPALIAGLLSIAAFAGLLRRLGYSHAGLALAALLCINPWHIRYSAEARSYTMLILFLALTVWCLVNALSSDRRRWWALFALAEFAALYSWKAAIHPCAAINLVALAILFFRLKRDAIVPVTRCLAANGFTLLAFIPLFGPGMPQIALNLARGNLESDGMGMDWYARVWSQILGAMDWSGGAADSPFQTISKLGSEHPILVYGFELVLVPAILMLGIVRLTRSNKAIAALLISPLFGLCMGIAHFTLKHVHMHKWYTFYSMPTVFALLAFGLTAWKPRHSHPILPALPTMFFVGLYLAALLPQLIALETTALADPRGADQLTRSVEQGYGNLDASDHITIGVYRRVVAYDPRKMQKFEGRHIRSAASLAKVLRHADANGKTVDVTAANLGFLIETHPDLYKLLSDERYFEPLGTLPAVESYIRIAIWRYLPGSLPAEP